MHWLSDLSSLTFVIFWDEEDNGGRSDPSRHGVQDMRRVVGILERIDRTRLSNVTVWVQYDLLTIAHLGSSVSNNDGASLEVCKALEDALLTFKACDVQIRRSSPEGCRAGRVEFWSPAITSAFPRLHGRGLLSLPHSE